MDDLLKTFKRIEDTVRSVAESFKRQPKQSDYTLAH